MQEINFRCLPQELTLEVIKQLKKQGMIALEDLEKDGVYKGICRNAEVSRWDGKEFIYWRHKWKHVFEETIQHPEKDDGYDVFVPVEKMGKINYEESK